MPERGGVLRAWAMALGFAALILAASSIPAQSMPQSQGLWRLDKLIHATEYALFATLVFRALRSSFSIHLVALAAITILACGAFGTLDELYQSTTPGRDSSIFDALADLIGASFASVASAVFYSRQRNTHGHHPQLQ